MNRVNPEWVSLFIAGDVSLNGLCLDVLAIEIVTLGRLEMVGLEDSANPAGYGRTDALFLAESDTAHDLFNLASVSTIRVSDSFPGDRSGRCKLNFSFCGIMEAESQCSGWPAGG